MKSINKHNIMKIITAIILCVIIVAIPLTIKLVVDNNNSIVDSNDAQNNTDNHGNGSNAGDTEEDTEKPKTITITISIDANNLFGENGAKYIDGVKKKMGDEMFAKLNNGNILPPQSITIEAGTSLRNIMKKIDEIYNIPVRGSVSYIASIQGLSEKMASGGSGWVYTLNGEKVMVAVNKQFPKDGDIIKWSYVL